MKLQAALVARNNATAALVNLFLAARREKISSTRLHQGKTALMDSLTAKKAPQWVRSYVDGYYTALVDNLYHSEALIYGGRIDGVFYSTHRNRDDYYEKHGITPQAWATDGRAQKVGHYWASDPTCPFFLG